MSALCTVNETSPKESKVPKGNVDSFVYLCTAEDPKSDIKIICPLSTGKKYYSTKAELGRGLGLFISSEIIKLHNNKYNVTITDNGIRFSFYLDQSEI